MQSEVEILEECLKEDDESKRKMGEEKVIEEDPRDRIGDMKPMTDGEDQRRDKIGVDAWVEEKLQERLKQRNQDS
jgi:LPS O-antigen subunit length determinant protein (WzzB/FepE family)